jgi:hypothetical protein
MPVASLVEKLTLSDLSNTPYPFPFVAFNLPLTAHVSPVNSVNPSNWFALHSTLIRARKSRSI